MIRAAMVLALLAGCASAPATVPIPGPAPEREQSRVRAPEILIGKPMVVVLLNESWSGVMWCETRATSWVRARMMLTPEGPQLLAHELDHEDFASLFPSCEAFKAWAQSDPRNPILVEARGHCAGARMDARIGRLTFDDAVRMHSARLAHNYPFGLSEAEAEAEIRRFCGPRSHPEPGGE